MFISLEDSYKGADQIFWEKQREKINSKEKLRELTLKEIDKCNEWIKFYLSRRRLDDMDREIERREILRGFIKKIDGT